MSQIIKPVALNETVVALNQTTITTNEKLEDIKIQLTSLAGMPAQIRAVLEDYAGEMGGYFNTLNNTIDDLPTEVQTALNNYATNMGNKFTALSNSINTTLTTLSTNLQTIFNRVASVQETEIPKLATSITTLSNTTGTKLDNVKGAIDQQKTALNTAIGTTLKGAVDDQKTTLNTAIGTTLKNTIEDLGDALVGVLASVKSINGETGEVVLDGNKLLINHNQQNSKTVTQMLNEMAAAIAETPLNFSAELITGTSDEYMVVVTQGTPS